MNLAPEELEELKESFDFNDDDKNGKIELDEFVQMLAGLEAQVSDEEARVGFEIIDTDGDGAIDFVEFLRWWSER